MENVQSKLNKFFRSTFQILGLLAAVAVVSSGPPLIRAASAATAQAQTPVQPSRRDSELLEDFLKSPNGEPGDNLFHAAFAGGPAIIPQLQAALKDDRTAEFAAQSLAFIGGPKARAILATLVSDPRDLDLRRFYYGSLGEFNDPESTTTLFNVVNQADREADRTVVEAAILALSVRSAPGLAQRLREVEKTVQDYVLQDDMETAATVIELRAKYLSTPAGKSAGSSIDQAIRTYFIPALEAPPEDIPPGEAPPSASIRVQELTFSPDKNRALAHVIFETPQALAHYRIVLQRRQGAWATASAWLGQETEKEEPKPPEPAKP